MEDLSRSKIAMLSRPSNINVEYKDEMVWMCLNTYSNKKNSPSNRLNK